MFVQWHINMHKKGCTIVISPDDNASARFKVGETFEFVYINISLLKKAIPDILVD